MYPLSYCGAVQLLSSKRWPPGITILWEETKKKHEFQRQTWFVGPLWLSFFFAQSRARCVQYNGHPWYSYIFNVSPSAMHISPLWVRNLLRLFTILMPVFKIHVSINLCSTVTGPNFKTEGWTKKTATRNSFQFSGASNGILAKYIHTSEPHN